MKTKKMSLVNIQGKLSRAEMKKIMAGSGGGAACNCNNQEQCASTNEMCINDCGGKPGDTYQGVCGCS